MRVPESGGARWWRSWMSNTPSPNSHRVVILFACLKIMSQQRSTEQNIIHTMSKYLRYLLIALLTALPLPAPEPDIAGFFERFTTAWVQADPELATLHQYLSGADQDRLDGQMT